MSEQEDQRKGSAGFEEEGSEQIAEEPRETATKKNHSKSDEWKRNLSAVFGSGVGKIAIIAAVIVVLGGAALGIKGMSSGGQTVAGNQARVDAPRAPAPEVSIAPISENEAERRAQRSALEAREAHEQGTSYQPGFDANVVENRKTDFDSGETYAFNVPGQPVERATDIPPESQIMVGAGKPVQGSGGGQSKQENKQQADARAKAEAEEAKRVEDEYKKAVAERDKFVEETRSRVISQIEKLMGESQGSAGFTQKSSFSNVAYYTPQKEIVDRDGNVDLDGATAENPDAIQRLGGADRPLLIKTGKIMYATLDSEINTDDGGDVLATVQGGIWSGSKLIGKIEQGPNNIRAKFTILAPQDDRPTMRINAVALREDDAKQGIAETIDNHTAERYFALGAAALLSGYGRAYQQTAGTTVISPGGVVAQTTQEPSQRQVIGQVVGEVGQSISSEVRRGFNRPTTYATPANKGFGLFFLQDVHEQSR